MRLDTSILWPATPSFPGLAMTTKSMIDPR